MNIIRRNYREIHCQTFNNELKTASVSCHGPRSTHCHGDHTTCLLYYCENGKDHQVNLIFELIMVVLGTGNVQDTKWTTSIWRLISCFFGQTSKLNTEILLISIVLISSRTVKTPNEPPWICWQSRENLMDPTLSSVGTSQLFTKTPSLQITPPPPVNSIHRQVQLPQTNAGEIFCSEVINLWWIIVHLYLCEPFFLAVLICCLSLVIFC